MPTITEALAEIKTIGKRLEKKRQFVLSNLARQDGVRDPLAKEGGSVELIKQERQAIADLEQRVVDLRNSIQRANETTFITVGTISRSINDWLVWRREVLPSRRSWLNQLQQGLRNIRENAKRAGNAVVAANVEAENATDIIVNIDEFALTQELEQLEEITGTLDGLLSLKNATVLV